MFTGLIEHQGTVISNHGSSSKRLLIDAPLTIPAIGESIAINGVCLTLLSETEDHLAFDVSPETLNISTLGQLEAGDKVNLERSMLANSRFGGHYVNGHVEAVAMLESRVWVDDCLELGLGGFSKSAQAFLLPKGSIALDGISLTINTSVNGDIKLMIVPHTLANTTLGQVQVGHRFNVEFDYLARIVAHQLAVSGQLNHEVLL